MEIEEYKVFKINGEKYFPESAVKMLIEEAKKQSYKQSATAEFERLMTETTGCNFVDVTPTKHREERRTKNATGAHATQNPEKKKHKINAKGFCDDCCWTYDEQYPNMPCPAGLAVVRLEDFANNPSKATETCPWHGTERCLCSTKT